MNSARIDRSKWQATSIFEQMGNIGSEVGRTYKAGILGDGEQYNHAMARALDLFDASVESKNLNYARKKEILRAKELFLLSLDAPATQPKLENYFTQFAIAARLSI